MFYPRMDDIQLTIIIVNFPQNFQLANNVIAIIPTDLDLNPSQNVQAAMSHDTSAGGQVNESQSYLLAVELSIK